ncbi:MAG TPA: BON domain-containing protein [Terriglobales bacterium]|jgi:osmotically-inducible protein OsmY|nr:BON domain-containing protein [Terriglobales bacterium]
MWKRIAMISASVLAVLLLALPLMAQHHPHQPNAEDLKIQQAVNQELAKHSYSKGVQATVDDHIATLTGSVDCYRDKLRAARAIRHAPGLEGTRNQIAVGGKPVSDDALREQIAKKLRTDRVGQGNTFNSFTLEVRNGVVVLGGEARTDVDRDSALAIVQDTCGVKDVVNQVKVLPVSTFDDRIRASVARAIYGDPVLQKYAIDPQQPIRIVVDHGHVTLTGSVNNAMDSQVAEIRAKEVPGVFSVTNKLYVPGKEVR